MLHTTTQALLDVAVQVMLSRNEYIDPIVRYRLFLVLVQAHHVNKDCAEMAVLVMTDMGSIPWATHDICHMIQTLHEASMGTELIAHLAHVLKGKVTLDTVLTVFKVLVFLDTGSCLLLLGVIDDVVMRSKSDISDVVAASKILRNCKHWTDTLKFNFRCRQMLEQRLQRIKTPPTSILKNSKNNDATLSKRNGQKKPDS